MIVPTPGPPEASVAVSVTFTGVMPPRTAWVPAKASVLAFSRAEKTGMLVLVDSVVVVKLPRKDGWMTKPEGTRVIVATWLV